MQNTWQPNRTLLTLNDDAGNTLAIVACDGGALGITLNGKPLPASHWPAAQMSECVEELLRLCGRID